MSTFVTRLLFAVSLIVAPVPPLTAMVQDDKEDSAERVNELKARYTALLEEVQAQRYAGGETQDATVRALEEATGQVKH